MPFPTEYTYAVGDILASIYDNFIPIHNAQFSVILNGIGTFTGQIRINDPGTPSNWPDLTTPNKRAIYVFRNGIVVWAGIIWTRKYDPRTGDVEIGASEFWSYLDKRIRNIDTVWTNQEQCAGAHALVVGAMQNVSNANIGLITGIAYDGRAATTSGVNLTNTWNGTDFRSYSSILEEVASTYGGFDFTVLPVINGTNPRQIDRYFQTGYPQYGYRVPGNFVFESGNGIINWTWLEDGTQQFNTIYARGSGYGAAGLTYQYQDITTLIHGYIQTETTISYKDTNNLPMLHNRAQADSAAIATVPILLVIDTDPSQGNSPVPGTSSGYFWVGDEVRVILRDKYFFVGDMVLDLRLTKFEVTPPQGGVNELVRLTVMGVQSLSLPTSLG